MKIVHEFIDRILIHELDRETTPGKSKSIIALSDRLIPSRSRRKLSTMTAAHGRCKSIAI